MVLFNNANNAMNHDASRKNDVRSDRNFIGVASLVKFFTICKSLAANEYL